MVAAAAAAKTMTQRSPDLRTYIFITASALLHELANLLVTYLTRGEMVTQRYMHSDIPYTAAHRGEAGQKLETILYGGTMVHYRDLGRDDEQVRAHDHSSLSFAENLLTLTLCTL